MPEVDPGVVLLVNRELAAGVYPAASTLAARLQLPVSTIRRALQVLAEHIPDPVPHRPRR